MEHKRVIEINLDKFKPRPYQVPVLKAMANGFKRILLIWPRRAGKDIACWYVILEHALRKVGIYWYMLPSYSQGRKAIFDGIDSGGRRFLDYIPKEVIDSINIAQQKITLLNGSIIQIVGSDNIDSLVGSNPRGVVFSEYSLTNPIAYQRIRPILEENDGWCIMVSTPRGKNHLYDLWKIAQNHPKTWFSTLLTVDDTKHISKEKIDALVDSGEMTEDMVLEEFYCSFECGTVGAYYSKYLDRMRLNNQIGSVPWEASFKVHTAWDLGMRDSTSIIFFQNIGTTIRIIDCYESSGVGLEHYAQVIAKRPYQYGNHFAPHDIEVRELGSGITRREKARQLGISFSIAPNIGIADGIEAVRSSLSKIYIDDINGKMVITMLENYRKEWDNKNKVYKPYPLHNCFSHMADALRYMCLSLPRTKDGMTATDVDIMRREALYGPESNLPDFFR
jgi:hypothetical protein